MVRRRADRGEWPHCLGGTKTVLGEERVYEPAILQSLRIWIIENGVKLTGMPAWSDGSSAGEEEHESWELVHFIRHLPELTPEELSAMARFNPVSRDELERQLEIERFLAGETQTPPEPHPEGHQH